MGMFVLEGGYRSKDYSLFTTSIENIKNQTGSYPATYAISVDFETDQNNQRTPRNTFPSNEMLNYLYDRSITPIINLAPYGPALERRDGRFILQARGTTNAPVNGRVKFSKANPDTGDNIQIYVSKKQTHNGRTYDVGRLVESWKPDSRIYVYGQNPLSDQIRPGKAAYNKDNKFIFNVTSKTENDTFWTINVNVIQAGTISENGLFSFGNPIYLTEAPGADARKLTNARIAEGSYDTFLETFTAEAKRYFETSGNENKIIIIRYAHEMNGRSTLRGAARDGDDNAGNEEGEFWFPWSPGQPNRIVAEEDEYPVPGDEDEDNKDQWGRYRYFNFPEANSPENYVAAWRHVYLKIKPVVPNVRFFWCPNNTSATDAEVEELRRFYPENDYVQIVGFDVYDWSKNNTTTSMLDLFDKNIRAMRKLTRLDRDPDKLSTKPIWIGETGKKVLTGANDNDAARTAWISNGYPAIFNNFEDVKQITYFNSNEWTMSPSMQVAYRELFSTPGLDGGFTPANPDPNDSPSDEPPPADSPPDSNPPQSQSGAISADPNPCPIAPGGTECYSNITWSSTSPAGAYVMYNGDNLASNDPSGTFQTRVTETGTTFVLYERESRGELSRVTAKGVRPIGTITIDPNPCTIATNATECYTNVSWDTTNLGGGTAILKDSKGNLASNQPSGSYQARVNEAGSTLILTDYLTSQPSNIELDRVTFKGVRQIPPPDISHQGGDTPQEDTPLPTTRPNATPTSMPTLIPTIALNPIPATGPNTTALKIVVGIDGIGITKRVPIGGNKNPRNIQRRLLVKIYKSADNSNVFSEEKDFNFSSASNKFEATFELPDTFEANTPYNVYLSGNRFLTKKYPDPLTITKNQTTAINSDDFNLNSGDINKTSQSENTLNILDYNILVSCSLFSKDSARSVCNQNPNYLRNSDLNDNGIVDQDDITLFIKTMSDQSGENLPQ